MKNLSFCHRAMLDQWIQTGSKRFLGTLVSFCLTLCPLNAQTGCDFVGVGSMVSCGKVTISLAGSPQLSANHWDFGDGTPILVGGPELDFVEHDYLPDLNPSSSPQIVIRHSEDGINWCQRNLTQFTSNILIGSGCGSQNTLSSLVANQILPANELTGGTIYVFGDLDVDIPYKFDGCTILISNGGEISVKSGGALTLVGNAMVSVFNDSGDADCQGLWNGIKILAGGSLTTNGAFIRHAYHAIRPVNPGNNTPLPKLSIRNTNFQLNFIGIYATEGPFAVSLFTNNTFSGSGNSTILPIGTCNPPATVPGVPYMQRTYCGIYFDGSMGGSLLLAGQSTGNVFQNLQAGIVSINGTCRVWGCRFSNITFLTNAPAAHQGTALTFIDNVGGKRLNFVGLGKESATATVSSCERGVYAQTSMPFTEAYVSDCKMVDIQNGVELEGTGQGNFSKGRVTDCHIDCTNYLANIKKRSTGIEVKDPNISYSDFFLFNNDINVNLQGAFNPFFVLEALTTGINVTAMHNQASASAMSLNIGHNKVNLLHGLNGITVENVANANIHDNEITKMLNSIEYYYCLSVVGGLNNTLTCNTVTDLIQQETLDGLSIGIVCEGSSNFNLSQNSLFDLRISLGIAFDNGTDSQISYNDLERNIQSPTVGVLYTNALTGPQYLRGNDWIGDFTLGAQYQQGAGAFTYCDSRYHVSLEANVANTTNLADPGLPQDCIEGSDDWFTVLEEQEGDLTCGSSTSVVSSISKNEADLNLAGGGTLSLSPGYKWSSEMGLYRKFTDNPGLVSGDQVITGFLQSQQELPVAAMYGVENGVREIEGGVPSGLMDDIQEALVLLATIEVNMLALLPDIETDTNAWASYATLTAQVENLGQLLDGYLSDALDTMAQSAAAVQSTNGSINCLVLPCISERYLIDLYLETQFVAPRALTSTELEAVEEIGMYCPKDAGNIVYMARAWYYMQTGEMLSADCGSFVPETVEERNILTQAISDGYFLLMPNPADGSVQVVLPANHGAGMLLLTDLWGRLLYQRVIPEETENVHISTEGLPNGIYMIVFKGQSGKPAAQKLVIQH